MWQIEICRIQRINEGKEEKRRKKERREREESERKRDDDENDVDDDEDILSRKDIDKIANPLNIDIYIFTSLSLMTYNIQLINKHSKVKYEKL